jgi:hypothetical protein
MPRGKQPKKKTVDSQSEEHARAFKQQCRRAKAYRDLAQGVGYVPGNLAGTGGLDISNPLLSRHDVQRMFWYNPPVNETSFPSSELKKRRLLRTKKITESAMQYAQARADVLLRKIMNELVLDAALSARLRITPHGVYSVLRRCLGKSMFTMLMPPEGLLEHARARKVL